MITIEEKLNLFTSMVLDKTKKEYDMEAKRLNEESQEKLEVYIKELNQKKEKRLHDMEKKGKQEKARLVSHANIDKMKALHIKKKEILEDVLKTLRERAHLYAKSDAYEAFFKASVQKAIDSFSDTQGLIFNISEKDFKKFGEVIYDTAEKNHYKKDHIQLVISKEDIIGGLICMDDQKTYKIDFSIKSIIKNNEYTIGTMLFNSLRGAEGTDD